MGHKLHLPAAIENERAHLPPGLERDLRLLSSILRRVVRREHGPELWQQVRELGELARDHEFGDPDADLRIVAHLSHLSTERMETLMTVFGHYFDIAEDLQRIRVIRSRRSQGQLADSLDRCLARLEDTLQPGALRATIHDAHAEFVFTAHPTEARRQTVRRILTRVREATRELDRVRQDPERRRALLDQLDEEFAVLTRTDSLHAHRPEILEELNRALAVSDSLWQALPALAEPLVSYGAQAPIRFGCWIGGDRDGHPFVTSQVTRPDV
ncbi:MAG: phosphoenolpyruvate carboxylase [Rhodothermales bacterium]|jgi:phosphoenolpyruvate carboxylase